MRVPTCLSEFFIQGNMDMRPFGHNYNWPNSVGKYMGKCIRSLQKD